MMFNMEMYRRDGRIANYDEEKGFHYGVINQHDVMSEAVDDIIQDGRDLYFEDALEEAKDKIRKIVGDATDEEDFDLAQVIRYEFCDHSERFIKELVEAMTSVDLEDAESCGIDHIDDEFGQEYENDTSAYLYEDDGYVIRFSTDDGDMFVIDSPFYTLAKRCSPCAPNAGYLTTPGSLRTYCLGTDWFEDEKAPYDIYRVGTDELVYKHDAEEE